MSPFFSILVSLFISSVFSGPYDAWPHSAIIKLNTSRAGVTGTVKQFPVLMRLTSSDIDFSQAKSDGGDIRFADNGTPLPYEIERWDTGNSLAEIWVLVDEVLGGSQDQFFTMYWGKHDEESESNGKAVFATSNHFSGVWHLQDQSFEDATVNGNHGSDHVDATGQNGIIGLGQQFDGTGDYVELGSAAGSAPSLTVALWMRAAVAELMIPIGKIRQEAPHQDGWQIMVRPEVEFHAIHFRIGTSQNYGGWGDEIQADNMYVVDQWAYVVGTYDGATSYGSMFGDGLLKDSVTNTDGRSVANTDTVLMIGNAGDTPEWFQGELDEIRISSVARSPDWIKLCFENQREAQTLITIDPADLTAPSISKMDPSDNEQKVSLNKNLRIWFSEAVKKGAGEIRIFNSAQQKLKSINVTSGSVLVQHNAVTINPFIAFSSQTGYYVEIDAGAFRDYAGNDYPGITRATAWNFTTLDAIPPIDENISPMGDGVEVDANLVINFSEAVQAGGEKISIFDSHHNVFATIDADDFRQVSISGTRATIIPPGDFAAGTSYYVLVTPGAFRDLSGNPYAGISDETTWAFTTVSHGTPSIDSLFPQVNATGVELDADLHITFSEPVNAMSGTITLYLYSDNSPVETFDVSSVEGSGSAVISLHRSVTLLPETRYYVLIDSTAFTDLEHVPFPGISGNEDWSFTTTFVLPDLAVAFSGLITGYRQPDLAGTVNDPDAEVTVKVGNQTGLRAVNNGNWTWTLPGSSLRPLDEDTYTVVVTGKGAQGMAVDSGLLKVDLTPPVLSNQSPEPGGTDLANPELEMTFNEAVVTGSGRIRLIHEGSGYAAATIDITSELVSRRGTNVFHVKPMASLNAGESYYILVDTTCFHDSAGHNFAGISSPSDWTFKVVAPSAPVVDSITSSSPPGVYGIGDSIGITIHFSRAMTLSPGGTLKVRLGTGGKGHSESIEAITSTRKVTFTYVVSAGHNADILAVLSPLDVDTSATLTGGGRPLVPVIIQSRNLPAKVAIQVDGTPPEIRDLLPRTNDVVEYLDVSFYVSEPLSSGTVTWSGITTQSYAFTPPELAPGAHFFRLPDPPQISRGERYKVIVSVTDLAGNTSQVEHDLVTWASPSTLLEVIPPDSTIQLKGLIYFQAFGRSAPGADPVKLDSVTWSLLGRDSISSGGVFRGLRLGESRVIGTYKGISDTALVVVASDALTIRPVGPDTLTIGVDVEVRFTGNPVARDTVLSVHVFNHTPKSFALVGPSLVFSDPALGLQNSATLYFEVDTLRLGGEDLSKVQVYRKSSQEGGPWILVPSELEGQRRLKFTTDTLGTFIVALDRELPETEWLFSHNLALSGQSINFSFSIDDEVANPLGRFLHVYRGGGIEDTIPLPGNSGQVPASLVDSLGLFYTVRVCDAGGCVYTDTVDVSVQVRDSIPSPVSLVKEYWQLVSIPMDPARNTVGDLFPGLGAFDPVRWRMYEFDRKFKERVVDDPLEPGRAYWLYTRETPPRMFLNASLLPKTLHVSRGFAVGLRERWNLVSSPYMFHVPVADVTLDGVGEAFYLADYAGQEWLDKGLFSDFTHCKPWRGYLVWNGHPGARLSDTLRFAQPGRTPLKKRAAGFAGHAVGVRVESGEWRDGRLVLGFGRHGSTEGRDNHDFPKPRFFSKPIEIGLEVGWDRGVPYLTDYRGELEDGHSWKVKVTGGMRQNEARLVFTGLARLPEGLSVMVLDEAREAALLLEDSVVSYTRLRKEEDFTVLIGTGEYLAEQGTGFTSIIRTAELFQNVPNPFFARTIIGYSIPGDSRMTGKVPVRLDIYDIQGALVRSLVNAPMLPGKYSLLWDARDAEGSPVSSGAYLYRLRAGKEFEARKKMLLLR